MDIAALSMALAQSKLQTDVGTAMLSKSLDLSETVGDSLSSMIDAAALEHSVAPHLGGNIDLMV